MTKNTSGLEAGEDYQNEESSNEQSGPSHPYCQAHPKLQLQLGSEMVVLSITPTTYQLTHPPNNPHHLNIKERCLYS